MKLLNKYSSIDYGVIASSIIIFQYLIERFRQYGILLGLPYQPSSNNPILAGTLIKDFCFNYLTLVILVTIIVSIRYSPKKLQSFYKPTFLVLMGLIGFTLGSVVSKGISKQFYFLGYHNLYVSFLIYYLVALFLLYIVKDESFPKAFLIITLGVLTVSHSWELPFNFYFFLKNGVSHTYFLIVNSFSWFIPIFFWFYITKKIYQVFIKKYWYIVISLISLIIFITTITIIYNYLASYWIPIGFTLRLSYALLIVFFPFYHYKRNKNKK